MREAVVCGEDGAAALRLSDLVRLRSRTSGEGLLADGSRDGGLFPSDLLNIRSQLLGSGGILQKMP